MRSLLPLTLSLVLGSLTACAPDTAPDVDGNAGAATDDSSDAGDAGDADAGSQGATDDTAQETAPATPPRRVLLVIADDLSAVSTPMYQADFPDQAFDTAPMPTVQALCDQGVRFRNAWSSPTCSPTRAMMLTGRHNFRNDTLELLGNADDGIGIDEPTLPRLLAQWSPETATANIGKWNLGRTAELGGDLAPNTMGWDHYSGLLDAVPSSYSSWNQTVDGVTSARTGYLTTATVDDAIDFLDDVGAEQSWVMWLAFNAPHSPFHLPPAELHDFDGLSDDPAAINADPMPYKKAMVQAMDTELGRLLAWLEANGQGDVDVIFVGDNGDDDLVRQAPVAGNHAKGTVYEGGVHVPLCVAGPSVAEGGRAADDLVNVVDMLATVLDLSGVPPMRAMTEHTFDSRSFAPVLRSPDARPGRTFNLVEGPGSISSRGRSVALRVGDDKLVQYLDEGTEELYFLDVDAFETVDMLAPVETEDDDDHCDDGRGSDRDTPACDDDDDRDDDDRDDDDRDDDDREAEDLAGSAEGEPALADADAAALAQLRRTLARIGIDAE